MIRSYINTYFTSRAASISVLDIVEEVSIQSSSLILANYRATSNSELLERSCNDRWPREEDRGEAREVKRNESNP